ncbi:MAG: RNA polymerase sigma factor [candidate division Zixibacteria bacterium]|nr:RNA polymerase sigma factor [candidate division Zixibacteria bacterium]
MKINEFYKSALSGNQDDINRLYETLSARFRLFMRHRVSNDEDVEDIVQDALMTILNEFDKIEIKTSFSAWAYKVLEYRFLAFIQKKGRRSAKENNTTEQVFANISDNKTIDHELRRRIVGCMQKLVDNNLRGARIINLYHQGFTTNEICERLNISITNYYTILSRTRSQLERCIKGGGKK